MENTSDDLKISAKGSRKLGVDFFNETEYLATLVNCIEIDFNYPHDADFRHEIDFLKMLQKNKGVNYTVHAQYFSGSINDLNEKIRKESIKQIFNSIDYASELNASAVTIHPGLEPYGLKLAIRTEVEIEAYRQIAAYAAERNILVGLENEAQTCFWFPDRACKFDLLAETITKVANRNFLMTLDVGHANVSGEDYLAAIEKYGSKIIHVHAHDNFGRPNENIEKTKRPDPHLAPGKGIIDWGSVVASLKKMGYQGYFELECEIHEMEKAIKYIKSL